MNGYFHLTIGPVQGFVSQARRTRDFWAGSFILSYLSAVAMKAVQQQDGEILFPIAEQRFLRCLTDPSGDPRSLPTQGGVPNRFKARVGDHFDPDLVTTSLKAAWRSLADLVWQRELKAAIASGPFARTEEIWRRQVDNFWEIVWARTPDSGASDILDRGRLAGTFGSDWPWRSPPGGFLAAASAAVAGLRPAGGGAPLCSGPGQASFPQPFPAPRGVAGPGP